MSFVQNATSMSMCCVCVHLLVSTYLLRSRVRGFLLNSANPLLVHKSAVNLSKYWLSPSTCKTDIAVPLITRV